MLSSGGALLPSANHLVSSRNQGRNEESATKVTKEGRAKRIKEELDLDVVMLNAGSHRLQAMLGDHPKLEVVQKEPWGEEAQTTVAELLRKRHRNFDALKDSLRIEGQRDPGVVTRKGVLINANSRTVGLRDLADSEKHWVRVAVLPPDADPKELARLELQLQVQDPLKDDYELTEELLFIEEMARDYRMSPEQIAQDLRWASDDGRSISKGAETVQQRRRILAMIQAMRVVPDPPIPLTFFDDKLEQLKALERTYNSMREDEPERARRFRDNWLVAALAGSSSVHALRAVDEDFAKDYLLPRLVENEQIGPHAKALVSPPRKEAKRKGKRSKPAGVDVLDPDGVNGAADGGGTVAGLLDVLASSEPTVVLPGSDTEADREGIKEAIKGATKGAIKDRKSRERAEGELDEPITHVREAARLLRKATETYRGVRKAEKFNKKRQGQLSRQLKQSRKALEDLEALASEDG
jgi:hypothetical protein